MAGDIGVRYFGLDRGVISDSPGPVKKTEDRSGVRSRAAQSSPQPYNRVSSSGAYEALSPGAARGCEHYMGPESRAPVCGQDMHAGHSRWNRHSLARSTRVEREILHDELTLMMSRGRGAQEGWEWMRPCWFRRRSGSVSVI